MTTRNGKRTETNGRSTTNERSITLLDDVYGGFILQADDGRELFLQLDWDYPGVASTFGWIACPCGRTDGTVDCTHRNASEMIADASEFLRDHVGDTAEDPGYFRVTTEVGAKRMFLADGMDKFPSPPALPEFCNADAARRPRRFIGPPPARPCQAEPVTGLALKAPPATATHGLASLALSYWRTAAARSPPPPPRQSACQASHALWPVTWIASLPPPRPLCCWLGWFSSRRASNFE